MRIIIGMTGASGAAIGCALLKALQHFDDVESHLVMSKGGIRTLRDETDFSYEEVCSWADYSYNEADIGARIASGSFATAGMVVAPCSMKTLSAIANAYDENLLIRAADVCLKEGRRVVLVPREMPLNRAHIRNMGLAADAGCSIVPPVLTFYNHPKTIEDQVNHIVGKVLMQFGLEAEGFKAWQGDAWDGRG